MGLITFILILLSPLAFAAFAILCWFIIDCWVDIIFKPLEFLCNKINSYLKQKELENNPHYIEGINDAVWS